jgi:hypothetical protein
MPLVGMLIAGTLSGKTTKNLGAPHRASNILDTAQRVNFPTRISLLNKVNY